MEPRFEPPFPPRAPRPAPAWRGLFGARARSAVSGWSRQAFDRWYIGRNVLGLRVHIPLHPDLVQQVLLDHADGYAKPDLVKRLLVPTIGHGLLSSDGESWRRQRRIIAASFTPARVESLVPDFRRIAESAMLEWRDGDVRDMAEAATRTTMEIISATLFGGDGRLTGEEARRHITAALESVGEARLQLLLRLPLVPLSRRGRAGRKGQTFLRATLTRLVDERLAGQAGDDFLARLMEALRSAYPAEEARALAVDNATTFYLAGHETTANAVAWTLYLLSEQPQVQEQAAEESRGAWSPSSGEVLAHRLPRLKAIVDESLRLYPPAPRFDRQALAPDRLGEAEVRPGDIVSIWPWLIHRHRRLWEEADVFDPDRFLGAEPGRHRFQYLPFGGGPRHCIGARFAAVETLAILAAWLRDWHFEPGGGRVTPGGMVSLRPIGGVRLRLVRRH